MRMKCIEVAVLVLLLGAAYGFSQEAVKKVSGTEATDAVVTRVQPEYPPIARQLRVQGTVELDATVAGTGTVDKVNIVSGNPMLTKPAAEALKKWKFRPFTEDGKAVTAVVRIAMSFKL